MANVMDGLTLTVSRDRSRIPLSAKVVAAVLKHFALGSGEIENPRNSVGVAKNSILATDGNSAVVVGDISDSYEATDWREADIAVTEASVYGQAFDLDDLKRIEKDGRVLEMPISGRFVAQRVESMQRVAVFDPATLIKVGQAAKAVGASSVEILQPTDEEGAKTIGFKFRIYPGDEIFDPEWTSPIDFVGVVVAQEVRKAPAQPAMQMDMAEAEAEPKRRKGPKEKEASPGLTIISGSPAPELIESVDIAVLPGVPPVALFTQSDAVTEIDTDRSAELMAALNSHKINAEPVGLIRGPTFSQYQVKPAGNVRAKAYKGAEADIQLALAAESVRIEAPIPGTHYVGIEVPNKFRQMVSLRSMLEHKAFWEAPALTIPIGLDVYGTPILRDIAKLPHLLIAGQTNSGKSIAIASLLCSLLTKNTPEVLRLVLIDPKMVELNLFEGIPHLMQPVITDGKKVPAVLRAVWREMDYRYAQLAEVKVRNIEGYNAQSATRMPYIVVVVDEIADLMISFRDEMDTAIQALTQKARAVGIHVILATQRPSVDVISGVIKANVPGRMAFKVAQANDSKVILDETGAESLLGRGDLLMCDGATASPVRVQGAFVTESEVERLVEWWKANGEFAGNQELIVDEDDL